MLLKAENEEVILGLDLDWPGIYKKVLSKTSQIHLCYSENKCCIFKVYNIKVLPRAFILLLKHPNVKLAGYNIQNDLIKLGKDFCFDSEQLLTKINSLDKFSNGTLCCPHNWDLKAVSEKALDVHHSNLPKSKDTLFKFKGCVRYSNHLSSCGAAAEQILNVVEGYSGNKQLILGFDIEWPFSFKGGSGKVALIQICPDKNLCFLLHVSTLTSLPKTLVFLLNHKHVKLVGVNIANDIRKIGRDFKLDVRYILENNIVELGTLANEVLNVSQRWSLAGLVLNQLGKELEKTVDVRCSNWAHEKLSQQQIVYAAADAYAGLAVYNNLQKIKEGKSHKKEILS